MTSMYSNLRIHFISIKESLKQDNSIRTKPQEQVSSLEPKKSNLTTEKLPPTTKSLLGIQKSSISMLTLTTTVFLLVALTAATTSTCYNFKKNAQSDGTSPHSHNRQDKRLGSSKLELGNTRVLSRSRRIAPPRVSSEEASKERRQEEEELGQGDEVLPMALARKQPSKSSRSESSQQQQQPTLANPAEGSENLDGTSAIGRGAIYKNVTAQNGHSVLLHCHVEPSGSGEPVTVSWFRGTGELQLLTYDHNTIIPDDRFSVKPGIVKGDWPLQIKNLDKNQDAGLYQCQTNSEPPVSQYHQLNIVEPQVHILGAPDMAVKLAAPINLTCVISQSADQLQFIFWYRDDRMINYDISEQRGKIVMSRGNSSAAGRWSLPATGLEVITSNLQIYSSKLSDSGNYTCQPSGARPTSIYVHVLEGSDKQLIMFQNDYDPAAASSQQSSAATSVRAGRLARAKAQALLASLLILANWFNLLAQMQTAISLFLLAVIGLFLGKLSESEPEEPLATLRMKPKAASSGELPGRRAPAEPDCQRSPTSMADRRLLPTSPASSTGSGRTNSSQSTVELATSNSDSLIRSANSALNLLRSIQEADRLSRRPEPTSEGLLAHNTSLASPSASSSSSTGYNSDARASPPALLVCGSRDESHLEPEEEDGPEMIELLRMPTALRLAMEELASKRGIELAGPKEAQPEEESHYSAPTSQSGRTTCGS